jgi:hypothetical protein
VFCGSANAWSGNGSFAGVLMSLLAILLFLMVGAAATGVGMGNLPVGTATAAVTGLTVLFGIIKFLFAVTKQGAYGAWIGLILLLAIAYGGYMKMQEANVRPGQTP